MFPVLQHFIDSQTWLDEIGDPLQTYLRSLFSSAGRKQIQDVLNGTWLGHPLHPVITDVPVGAWTTTLVLDTVAAATNNDSLATASTISVATGLTAAVGAAATGFTDWSDTYGRWRRVGLLHGLTMVGATTMYALSLFARLAGRRSMGVGLSNTGLVFLSAGAYLGGDEVFDLGYPVNQTAMEQRPSDFVGVMADADLKPDTPTKAEANGVSVMLVKTNGRIYALSDTCVHAGCSLAGGTLEDLSIVCPCHGSQYDLRDGSVLHGPATYPEPAFDARVRNGMIEVRQASV